MLEDVGYLHTHLVFFTETDVDLDAYLLEKAGNDLTCSVMTVTSSSDVRGLMNMSMCVCICVAGCIHMMCSCVSCGIAVFGGSIITRCRY